jgi:hypothetical protein
VPEPLVVVAPTIVRFTMQGDINGRNCYNLVDVSLDEFVVSRETAVSDLAGRMPKVWQTTIVGALGGWYSFHGASWMDLDSEDGITGFQGPDLSSPVLGGTGGSLHTPNTAALIHKQTSSRRNARNGRMYLGPILETDCDDGGVLSTGCKTRFTTAAAAFRTAIIALGTPILASIAWRVVHVESKGEPDDDFPGGRPLTWNSSTVSGVTCDAKAATQRRRMR